MKFQLIVLLFSISFLACGQSSTKEKPTIKEASTTSTKSNLPERKEACEFFSIEEVGDFFNWNPSVITQKLMMKLEDYNQTFCNHYTPDGEKFILRIDWNSEKAQQNKVLEKRFSGYLAKGEDSLKYKKSNTSIGTESIFGQAPDRDHKPRYILRTRFQNEVEIIIEGALNKNSPEDLEKKFKEILEKTL